MNRPISINLGTKSSFNNGNPKFLQIKGQTIFKGEIHYKNRVGPFKNLLKSHWARKAQVT
jgi:hypothetical protein